MAPFVIVIIEPPAQTLPQRLTGVECVQVNVLVFEGPPQPLDEYIVLATTPTIHTDGDLVIDENLGERVAGKLSPLVGIEDFRWLIAAQRLFKGIDTKGAVQGVGYPPRVMEKSGLMYQEDVRNAPHVRFMGFSRW